MLDPKEPQASEDAYQAAQGSLKLLLLLLALTLLAHLIQTQVGPIFL